MKEKEATFKIKVGRVESDQKIVVIDYLAIFSRTPQSFYLQKSNLDVFASKRFNSSCFLTASLLSSCGEKKTHGKLLLGPFSKPFGILNFPCSCKVSFPRRKLHCVFRKLISNDAIPFTLSFLISVWNTKNIELSMLYKHLGRKAHRPRISIWIWSLYDY